MFVQVSTHAPYGWTLHPTTSMGTLTPVKVIPVPAGLNLSNVRGHGGLEGSDLDEAGGWQGHGEPEGGKLPSSCCKGERDGRDLAARACMHACVQLQTWKRIEFHKHVTLSVSVPVTSSTPQQ